jgi:hypothetical protein
MKKNARTCQDRSCNELIPKGRKRHRCGDCGLLVCNWCAGHVHKPKTPARRKQP